MHRMTQNDVKYLSVKSALFTLNTHPRAQISLCVTLRQIIFETQACRTLEMHRMTPDDFRHLTVKGALYRVNIHAPSRPKFHSNDLYD